MGFGSFFGFGSKKKTNNDYGKKQTSVFGRGLKFISDHAGAAEDIANEVGSIAGMVGNVAGVAAPILAATGVGAPLAGVAAGIAGAGKAIQGGAALVSKAAGTARTGTEAARGAEVAIDRLRGGDIRGAVEAGGFAAERAGDFRKAIERKKKKK